MESDKEILDEELKEHLQAEFLRLCAFLQGALEQLFRQKVEFVLTISNERKQVMSLGTLNEDEQIEMIQEAIRGLRDPDHHYKYAFVDKDANVEVKSKQEIMQEGEQETKH